MLPSLGDNKCIFYRSHLELPPISSQQYHQHLLSVSAELPTIPVHVKRTTISTTAATKILPEKYRQWLAMLPRLSVDNNNCSTKQVSLHPENQNKWWRRHCSFQPIWKRPLMSNIKSETVCYPVCEQKRNVHLTLDADGSAIMKLTTCLNQSRRKAQRTTGRKHGVHEILTI